MAKDTAFPFFFNWRKPFEMLSGDECKALLIAMLDYVEHGTEPPAFTERAEMAAAFVFPALDRSREIKESRSRAGKIGNETRWKAAADEHKSVANDRTTSQNIANDCTASLKEKRREENKRKDAPPYPPTGGQGESARDELFEKFWMEYPKKAKRTEAEEAWKALAPTTLARTDARHDPGAVRLERLAARGRTVYPSRVELAARLPLGRCAAKPIQRLPGHI